MPVLRFSRRRLEELTGLGLNELKGALFKLKCEAEEDGDQIVVEVNADRPDMFIGEGIAKAVRSLLGRVERSEPELLDSGIRIHVTDVPTRPFIVAAVVYDVNVNDEEYLQELIQFQEKLNEGLGRRRRKAAIGFHDLSKMPSRELRYEMVDVGREFVPLGSKDRARIVDVLEGSEKGRLYGHIARAGSLHPAILAGNDIIAIPPVLNSEITKIEVGTRDLFIDITATDLQTASAMLDIIVHGLAERGKRIGSVKVFRGGSSTTYPERSVRVLETSARRLNSVLGMELSASQIADLLSRMGYETLVKGESIEVRIPPHRVDVMGEVDIAEDIAIYIGYDALQPKKAAVLYTLRGSLTPISSLSRKLREILIGMGFTEVMQLSLTSPSLLKALNMDSNIVEVANPVQVEYSVLRPMIAATMLKLLSESSHVKKPVKVFEIGPVAMIEDGKIVDEEHLAMAIMDDEVSYELIQAPLYTILRSLGIEFTVSPTSAKFLMEGRAAVVRARDVTIGILGEVNPETLERLNIESPIVMAEISVSALSKLLRYT